MPKLKRRDVVLIPVLAAGAYAGGHFSQGLAPQKAVEKVPGTIGPIVVHDAFLETLQRTVSPNIVSEQIGDFIELAQRKFAWVLHPLTKTEDFERKLCSEFLINSNLIENGYDVGSYEFSEYPGVCSPFLSVIS
jgi:hypothetical protein